MVLGENFVGAYLQGSFAVGEFDRHSDVDFIIVVEEELSDDQVLALQIMHERIFNLECEWARHLEGSYYPERPAARLYPTRPAALVPGQRSPVADPGRT